MLRGVASDFLCFGSEAGVPPPAGGDSETGYAWKVTTAIVLSLFSCTSTGGVSSSGHMMVHPIPIGQDIISVTK